MILSRLQKYSYTLLLIFFILTLTPPSAPAFYERYTENGYIDARLAIRLLGAVSQNRSNRFFYPHEQDASATSVGRLILIGKSRGVTFNFNAFNANIHSTGAAFFESSREVGQTERSPALELKYIDEGRDIGSVVIDNFNLSATFGRADITIGRQPVNFGVSFYFAPNDFFAPFRAQTFYRLYKPGVDAARVELGLGPLTQLTLLGALGYETYPTTPNGYSYTVAWDRLSSIARLSTVINDFELAVIAGNVHKRQIIGGSLQGELFSWLGIRAEGHYADPKGDAEDAYTELAIELDHMYPSSLNIRFSQFYHGSGNGSAAEYAEALQSGQRDTLYLGKLYSAVGAGYQFSPLTNGEALILFNLTDDSYLVSLNAVHFTSDESELVTGISLPFGKEPAGARITSEYGLFPYAINLEYRIFF